MVEWIGLRWWNGLDWTGLEWSGVVKCLKRNTLRWCGHSERMKSRIWGKKSVFERD